MASKKKHKNRVRGQSYKKQVSSARSFTKNNHHATRKSTTLPSLWAVFTFSKVIQSRCGNGWFTFRCRNTIKITIIRKLYKYDSSTVTNGLRQFFLRTSKSCSHHIFGNIVTVFSKHWKKNVRDYLVTVQKSKHLGRKKRSKSTFHATTYLVDVSKVGNRALTVN